MSETKVLSLRQAVRKRPGMYVGDEGPARLQHLIDELVSNAIDQYLRGQCSRISVRAHDDGWIDVADDGPGLPFDTPGAVPGNCLATHYLTHAHDAPTADGLAPHTHVHSLNGVGIAVVNAASRVFICRSWHEGTQWEQRFACGEPSSPPLAVDHGGGRGTLFRFLPDADVLGVSRVDQGALRASLWRTAHLFGGITLCCGDEVFVAPGGLADYLHTLQDVAAAASPRWHARPVFRWHGRYGDYAIDAAASGFAAKAYPGRRWYSWVNGRSTPLHGSHVDGFMQALDAQGWRPQLAMLHIVAHDPRYAGPTRDRYVSGSAQKTVECALREPLRQYCNEHIAK
ncbi:MAG: hypothetical protein JNN30_15050 [Rhodanobacteraceae bacterium]|nr:hypothetical protein [Rhodanobacteraceae bacterium]